MSLDLKLYGDERIIIRVRKHWFVLLRERILGVILSGFLPLIVLWVMRSAGIFPHELTGATALWVYLTALWLMLITMTVMTIWTNYYLDIWVVTTKRIINIDQQSLFHRDVTTMPLEMIQDATIETHGVIETLLNFGTLKIHSAGPVMEDTKMIGITNPHGVKNIIIEAAGWESGLDHDKKHGVDVLKH